MWADRSVVLHISGTPLTREQSWSRLLRSAGHWKLLGFGYWVVEAKDDGRFLGEVGFADYRREITPSLDGAPEAGWVLKRAEHGKGFASEAVARIHQWADITLADVLTVCILDPQHEASRRVACKVGYRDEAMTTYQGLPTLVMARAARGRQ